MLDEDEARRERIARREREKIPAADLDPGADDAMLPTSPTSPEDPMAKSTAERQSRHREKRNNELIALRNEVATLRNAAAPKATYRVVSEAAPRGGIVVRFWNWLTTTPPEETPRRLDLVALRRDMKELARLHKKIEKLKAREEWRDIKETLTRMVFLVLSVAFYVLLAYSAAVH